MHTRFVHHVENAAMALTLGTMLATMGTISRRRGEERERELARAHATHGKMERRERERES